jgi:uncharacterized membrane protein
MSQESIRSPGSWYSIIYRNLHVIYFCLIAPYAISMCFLLPPLQTPDEWAHYARTVAVSGGNVVGERGEGPRSGTNLVPASLLPFLTHPKFSTQYYIPGPAVAYTSPPYANLHELKWSTEQVAIQNPFIAYPATSYLPGAIGISIAKAAGLSMVPSYYVGRFLNCIVSLLLASLAIFLLPRGKLIALLALSAPSTVSLFGSYSQDAMLICYVGVAVGMLLQWHDKSGRKSIAPLVAASVLISLTIAARPPYIPLALLLPGYLVMVHKNYKSALALLGLTMVYPIVWALTVSPLVYHDQFPGVNEVEQIRGIIAHPINFVKLIFSSDISFKNGIGVIGSNGLTIPSYGYTLFYLACAICVLSDIYTSPKGFDYKFRIYSIIIGLGCLALLLTTSYICWTPVHGDYKIGLTGRYLIPVILLGSTLIGRRSEHPIEAPNWLPPLPIIFALCLIICVNFISIITTLMGYYYIR